MIFGLAVEVLILVLIGWGVTSAYRRFGPSARPSIPDYTPPRTALLDDPVERSVTEEVDARHQVNPPPRPQLSPRVMREKRMAELQRLYVADEITVEQYEKELDALMRDDTSKPD